MKKYVKLFVMTVLALSLTACGGAEEETVKETVIETEEVYYEEDDYSYDNDYTYEESSVDQGADDCLGEDAMTW